MCKSELPHQRLNLLTGQWMLVSPQRSQRPWQGKQESVSPSVLLDYDPTCYLCPGNARANGQINPKYEDAYVFENDFPALLSNQRRTAHSASSDDMFREEAVEGSCRVVCFSPRHDLTLPQMELSAEKEDKAKSRKRFTAEQIIPKLRTADSASTRPNASNS